MGCLEKQCRYNPFTMKRLRLQIPGPAVKTQPPAPVGLLTLKMVKCICRYTQEGHTATVICDYLGISHSAFASWVRKGMDWLESSADQRTEDHAMYGYFVRKFRRAFAKYHMGLGTKLHRDGNSDWVRIITILERRDRSTYGRRPANQSAPEDYDQKETFL